MPIDHLVYNIPSLAPIRIEASAICPDANGVSKRCADYDDASDSVSGKLQVVGADIVRPKIDLFLQHGSEQGLDDVSVCLMREPLVEGQGIGGNEYKWVLGVRVSPCPYYQPHEPIEKIVFRFGKTQNLQIRTTSLRACL
jgi:hypothetical protein